MCNGCKHEAKPRNSEVREMATSEDEHMQCYKQRRKLTKSHIINVLLNLFARSVRENICLLFFYTNLAPSLLGVFKNLKQIHSRIDLTLG